MSTSYVLHAGTGKTFEVIEATSAQRNILNQKTGSSSVPNIWVKGKYVGGCNDGPGTANFYLDCYLL